MVEKSPLDTAALCAAFVFVGGGGDFFGIVEAIVVTVVDTVVVVAVFSLVVVGAIFSFHHALLCCWMDFRYCCSCSLLSLIRLREMGPQAPF